MFGYIYETTNLINGKTYIGKKQGEFDKTYYGSGVILKQALEKYGKNNFNIKILSTHESEQDLNNAEIMFIETRNPVYNIAKGGTGGNTLARADNLYKKEVVAKRATGVKNAWHNASDEQRKQWGENISKAKKGKATRPADYRHSEDVKKRIKESNKKTHKNRPESWYKAHADAAKKRIGVPNIHNFKPVEIDGVVYASVKEAYTTIGISDSTFYKWVKKGKAKYV